MKRESFYSAIGGIDDDLIQEASQAHGHKKNKLRVVYLAGMAACLCLICTALFFGLYKDVVSFNDADAPIAAKALIPADQNTTILTLTYHELFDYYGLEPFSDRLSGLYRIEQAQYFIYQDSENITYDTNVLQYRSADGDQALSIVLAKEDPFYEVRGEAMKRSRINGVSLVLAASEKRAEDSAHPIYWAEIYDQAVHLRIVSSGMDESSFINIIRQIIGLQK